MLFQLHWEAHVSPWRANRGKSVCDYCGRGVRVGIGDEVGAFGHHFQGWLLVLVVSVASSRALVVGGR